MNHTKSNKELKKFAYIFTAYAGFFSLILYKTHHYQSSKVLLFIIACVIIAMFINIKYLLPLNKSWNHVIHLISWINTRILFGLIFFGVFSPIAFWRRLVKKDILRLSAVNTLTYRIQIAKKNIDPRKPY